MDILSEVSKIEDEIKEYYHILHKNPEMGNMEFATTKFIKDKLESFGIETISLLETGVVGILKGDSEGKTIALRADIDALKICENTNLHFKSTNGLMHACGHDMHTSALLGAAKILAKNKHMLKGNVKFIFQPDEEGNGGAKRLIEKGVLKNPKVDKIYAMHVRPELKCGVVAFKYGKSYAASDMFSVKIMGKSAHGAEAYNGIDSIVIASNIIVALQSIVSRNIAPTNSAVVTVGSINGGSAGNIIAGETSFMGIMRTLGSSEREFVKNRFCDIVNNIANAMGAKAEITITESYPGVVNNNSEVDLIKAGAIELLGNDKVLVLDEPTLTTEDFGYFLNEVDGCFYHIGVESDYALHNDKFKINEDALKIATALHIKAVMMNIG